MPRLTPLKQLMPTAYLDQAIQQTLWQRGATAQYGHRQTQPDDQTLKQILSHQSTRKISKQVQISYLNVIYQIQTNSPSYNMRGASVTVCESNGQITLLYKNKPLQYKIFDKHNQPTKVIDTKNLDNHIKKVKNISPPQSILGEKNTLMQRIIMPLKPDISTLHKTGYLYFAFTVLMWICS